MKNVLDEILKLSVSERIEMVEAIWDSIADEKNPIELSDEHKNILQERLAEYKTNPNKGTEWSELKQQLEDEL